MTSALHTATAAPDHPPMRRFANLLYRRPSLYLTLLLVPPLLWFGAIYLGSLLNLLWQGFYSFDDFTMAVTPDLTLGNFATLFNPANLDIILRTLGMAVAVSIASAVLAFPIAYYMARYTRGRTKAFFYIAVMLPMWASYMPGPCCWPRAGSPNGSSSTWAWSRCCNGYWACPGWAAARFRPRIWDAFWCSCTSGCRS
jgi:putative spermidine/putrescine transport system permease protein